ncbi:hypothetical protein [Saccharopolyspora hattusasensis]|uniref:hypothetical protein n=1 Tax=Saccharopolyspora hattusasensis TaxID=1128679 RepID=UPI003D98B1BC
MLANADAYRWQNERALAGLLAAFTEIIDAYAEDRDADADSLKRAVREALEEHGVNVDLRAAARVPAADVARERAQFQEPRGEVARG